MTRVGGMLSIAPGPGWGGAMMRVWKSPSRGLHALDSLWPALVLSVVVGLGGYTLGP